MPVEIGFEQVGAIPIPVQLGAVEFVLRSTCEKSVEALRSLVLEELVKRITAAEITEGAKEKFPFLADLGVLLESYRSCFQVDKVANGATLAIDRGKLQALGLPVWLPEALEYGDPVGIATVAHRRPAWQRFLNEVVDRLGREAISELS